MTSSYSGQAFDFGPDSEINNGSNYGESGQWNAGWNSGAVGVDPPTPERAGLLARIIEGEVIPRLLLAHSEIDSGYVPEVVKSLSATSLPSEAAFAELALRGELPTLLGQVQTLLNQGVEPERLCLDLLAPVARLMGIYWVEDRWSFADVTLGLGRLHQILHDISRYRSPPRRSEPKAGRAFFAPVPGDQHSFGLVMVEDFFQRAGWSTASDPGADRASILRRVATEAFDVIGFSVCCEHFLDPLSALVIETRKVSRNRDILILVGGRLFQDEPALIGRLEGVTVASDGAEAVLLANKLLPHQTGEMSRVLM